MTAAWVTERLRSDPIARFRALARSVTVVGVGESSHHTAEYPALRRDLVAALLCEGGTSVIALEAVPPGPNPIDKWVTDTPHAQGDAADALLATGVRMWRNSETVALVEMLRDFNRSGAGIARVRGIDVLTPGRNIRRVFAQAPALGLPLEESVDLAAITRGLDTDGMHDQSHFDSLTSCQRSEMERQLSAALVVVNSDEQRLRNDLGDAGFEALRRDVAVSVRALATLRAGAGDWIAGLPARDRGMAENVADLERSEQADRYVVLSHNTHVAASPTVDGRYAPMGSHLRRWFGAAYAAVGTMFGSALFDPPIYGIRALPAADESIGTASVDDGPVDALVAAATSAPAWLDLRAEGPDMPMTSDLRSIGGGHSRYELAAAFDALIYVPRLTTARQLVDTDLGLTPPPRGERA